MSAIVPRWKPGQSGNPSGRPRIPDYLRNISQLSQAEVCGLVSKYARMTREQLDAAVRDTSTPMIELTIASIFAQSAKRGDFTRLAFLLDRAVGKAPIAVHGDAENELRRELAELSTQELVNQAKEALKLLEAI